jgi:hypothetical protein
MEMEGESMKKFQRIAALLLILTLVCSALPASEVKATEVPAASRATSTRSGYLSVEEAAQKIKQHMLERNTEDLELKVYIRDQRALGTHQLWDLFQDLVYQHTGVPNEGDYLRYSGQEITPEAMEHTRVDDEHWLAIRFSFRYLDTAEEEKTVTAKVKQIFDSLDLEGKSDYDKIQAIYNYVCANVEYDFESAENPNKFDMLQSNSAYAALVEQKATCGGFALAIYRLLLEAGIDNRMECVAGGFSMENGKMVDGHAWNKVKLGDLYYYLDATWDSGLDPADYRWFLSGSADFLCDYHYSDTEHLTKEFMEQFPMAPISYGKPATATGSGSCGENATWTLTEDGTLTISGTGDMIDTKASTLWYGVNMYVKKVIIQEGITSIGEYAFWNCPQLESVIIPSTVTKIGSNAFGGCSRIKELVIPDSVAEIEEAAFNACAALEKVVLPKGLKVIREYTFNCCSSLKTIEIPAAVTTIEEGAFAAAFDPKANVTLVVPETVTRVANMAIGWSNVRRVIWKARIEEPADGIFYMCNNLESVELTDYIKKIGARSFTWCYSLRTVKLPAGLVEIVDEDWTSASSGLFMDCYSLESIAIPAGITKIPKNTFDGCCFLTSVELHDGITEIGSCAFRGTRISELVIPASVVKIGHWAFGWTKLGKLVFEGDAPSSYENEPEHGLFPGGVYTDVYYPYGNPTWTEDAKQALVYDASGIVWKTKHPVGAPHMPREDVQWRYDEVGHWHECLGCDEKMGYEEHSLSEYLWDVDRWVRYCLTCYGVFGYEEGPEQGPAPTEPPECDHVFDNFCDDSCDNCGFIRETEHNSGMFSDEDEHWLQCIECNFKKEGQEHSFDNNCDERCDECGYIRVPKHGASWEITHAWHKMLCPDCGYHEEAGHKFGDDDTCVVCGYAPYEATPKPEQVKTDGLWICLGSAAAVAVAIGLIVLVKKKKAK